MFGAVVPIGEPNAPAPRTQWSGAEQPATQLPPRQRLGPDRDVLAVAEAAVAAADEHGGVAAPAVAARQVEDAVAVEVAGRDGVRAVAGRVRDAGQEAAVAAAAEHGDRLVPRVGG